MFAKDYGRVNKLNKIDYSKKTIKHLENLADKWFSIFIRLRDSNSYGWGHCCTCNRPVFWKNADNGHFVKRGHKATRYNEQNCGLQCRFPCNRMRNGENQAHRMYIDNKYGEGTASLLKKLGKFPMERTKEEYIILIEHYRGIVLKDHRYTEPCIEVSQI
jgi:hypothetical protein